MVDDHLAAILYGEAVLRPAMGAGAVVAHADMADDDVVRVLDEDRRAPFRAARMGDDDAAARRRRSEEHTSELQSLMRISYAVFCLKNKTDTVCGRHTEHYS